MIRPGAPFTKREFQDILFHRFSVPFLSCTFLFFLHCLILCQTKPSSNPNFQGLKQSVELRPDIQFTVIVNPDSGPGDGPTPDDRYTEALKHLSSYHNVRALGYVRTGYATRSKADVLDEIQTYAAWSSNSTSLAMHGVFLDETPHQYTAEAAEFLREVGDAIRNSQGLQSPNVVRVPAAFLVDPFPSLSVFPCHRPHIVFSLLDPPFRASVFHSSPILLTCST
jgi:hypothetical protein